MNELHIITVRAKNFHVSYDIKNVNSKLQIVATFTKEGKHIHSIYNIYWGECQNLFNKDYATRKAQEMIEDANKSKHSPFLRG